MLKKYWAKTVACSFAILFGALAMSTLGFAADEGKKAPPALAFEMETLDGKKVALDTYSGKVILVVNVASECGLTPQYEALQELYGKYKDKGLVILGFPCNQFGSQEPGTAAEIKSFCTKNYGVTFDMFAKVDVNGDNAAPFFKHLTALETKPKGSGKVGWNFEKFLIGRDGTVAARYAPTVAPDAAELVKQIEELLSK
jgi:glutathione peroxidase